MSLNIGFISTRFSGTDGVSLESQKWADVLEEDGHRCFWFAGKIDRPEDVSMCVPEAHFTNKENEWINAKVWNTSERHPNITKRIARLSEYLREEIREFVQRFDLDMLIAQNVLTIPMHIPLGVALTQFLCEHKIPTIAHHHDFYWERDRFMINAVPDYLEMSFPPRDTAISHVVINSTAIEALSWRKGLASTLVPNVIDFETPPPGIDTYNKDFRADFGFEEDDIIFLQPTRIVPRKGIEHAIKLIELIDNPKVKLVITHEAGDEGTEYLSMLEEMATLNNVDMRIIDTRVSEKRQRNDLGQKIYTLWDIYPHADFVTYPSLYEGFGNAFLEALYFKLPVLVNRYSIYAKDIEPKGFKVISMDNILTQKNVKHVLKVLEDESYRKEMVDYNFEMAQNFYSYKVLRRKLRSLISNIHGDIHY